MFSQNVKKFILTGLLLVFIITTGQSPLLPFFSFRGYATITYGYYAIMFKFKFLIR